MKTLFVAWKQKDPGGWYPVGRLDADTRNDVYVFRYTRGALVAARQAGFAPFDSFPEFEKQYVSRELFPFFQNRLQNQTRPSFPEYLARMEIDRSNANPDPLQLLALSEGKRETDTVEIFPRIEHVEGEPLVIHFFLHGLRFLPPHSLEETLRAIPGQELTVAVEVNNPAAGLAIQFQTRSGLKLGYAPRYLVQDLAHAALRSTASARIQRVNPPPTPLGQRLLVRLECEWPSGYRPMSGETYQPIAGPADSIIDPASQPQLAA
jgi:hypothetical protein